MNDNESIRITGRTKDIIIVVEKKSGKEVNPFASSPNRAAIVGKPDDRLGEIGCAFVLPSGDPPTLEDLTGFLKRKGQLDSSGRRL